MIDIFLICLSISILWISIAAFASASRTLVAPRKDSSLILNNTMATGRPVHLAFYRSKFGFPVGLGNRGLAAAFNGPDSHTDGFKILSRGTSKLAIGLAQGIRVLSLRIQSSFPTTKIHLQFSSGIAASFFPNYSVLWQAQNGKNPFLACWHTAMPPMKGCAQGNNQRRCRQSFQVISSVKILNHSLSLSA